MEERGNKTIICSVFFLDIVEYSKKSVSGQISQKERFNAFLSNAIRDVPVNDRIILDTGDGAAISFLGDVEDALRAALRMRKSLQSAEGLIEPPLLVRMGVNLGPVRLVKDINGQPNIVGDGINVAQRIMGFASPGQILVSRSYYDAASRLSQEYTGMFQYCGARTDKHVREHEVYEIGNVADMTATQPANRYKSRSKYSDRLHQAILVAKGHWKKLLAWSDHQAEFLLEKFKLASGQQRAMYVGLALLPVLLLLVVVKLAGKNEMPTKALPKVAKAGAVAASGVIPVNMLAASTVISSSAVASAVGSPKIIASAPVPNKRIEEKLKEDKKAAQIAKIPKSPEKPIIATGLVVFSIKPWGDVYLDGKMIDASPPLTKLKVAQGEHVIEIKNTTFPVYKQSINIKAGEKLNIKYKFSN